MFPCFIEIGYQPVRDHTHLREWEFLIDNHIISAQLAGTFEREFGAFDEFLHAAIASRA
jgi:hypothetical protein